ncbi:hypothetical protein [Legionella gresilensis]|uniref:hypothetical protein n=1 Tax=Legionella gresilensis TaxID=91823 RepID=UPI001041AF36|nr:hypothetical protein [Legionella gresilensis]
MPNIQQIILSETEQDILEPFSNLLYQRYLWELGDRNHPPSLLNWCTFYTVKKSLHAERAPNEVKKLIE